MNEEPREILLALIETQYAELVYHRGRQDNVFSLTTTVFFAVTGYLFTKSADSVSLVAVPPIGKMAFCSFILATAGFSFGWQLHHYIRGNRHKIVIANAWKRLQVFDMETGEVSARKIMHDGWDKWGDLGAQKHRNFDFRNCFKWIVSRPAATIYFGLAIPVLICLR